MKPSPHLSRNFPSPTQSRRGTEKGMALVIVLGLLVLVLILVVAFFSSVSVELQSAKRYSNGADARALADSAVSMVISQIQDATAAPRLAWASQPGMIRTYDSNGNAVTSYKLYSSSQPRVTGNFNAISSQTTEVPADWATSTTLYTDLNKPVAVAGTYHYPILDPAAVAANVSGGAALSGTSAPIEGCFLNTANPAVVTSATQTNPVPMPVQWMYVLKNGALAAMDPSTKKVTAATPANPIVGRVAFWTDDESSKVNINTASEGTYWDRPWSDGATTGYEKMLSTSMPVANEFQRFPGHPALTSLSVVFPPIPGSSEDSVSDNYRTFKNRIYGIIPRISGGGSDAGNVTINGTSAPIVNDNDRLFASVDEFLFQAVTSGTRLPNLKGPGTNLTEDDIQKTRFFLTANSRSPDVNLFNKPRVALWPLQANTADISNPAAAADRNAKDKLIAFCSTIGNTPYYFQRYNTYTSATQSPMPSSQSPTMDWSLIPRNQALYGYLQSLTSSPIPGLGGSLAGSGGKYTTPARDQILTEMMDFLRSGVNTFRTKPTAAATALDSPYYNYVPFGVNAAGVASGWVPGQSQVVPLVITPPGAAYQTKGFGRFSTITQAALIFYRTDKLMYVPEPNTAHVAPVEMPSTSSQISLANIRVLDASVPQDVIDYPSIGPAKMRAVILLQTFNPTPGLPPWSGNARYTLEGANSMYITTTPLGPAPMTFPSSATNLVDGQEGYYDATALSGFEVSTQYFGGNTKKLGTSDEQTLYPFVSGEYLLSNQTFSFTSGSITIKIYPGFGTGTSSANLVQTITMNFPATGSLPIPTVNYSVGGFNTTLGTRTVDSDNEFTDYDYRMGYKAGAQGGRGVSEGGQHNPLPYIRGGSGSTARGDIVRSVQARYKGPALGDYRVIDALANVPDDFFEGHGMKDTPTDGLKYSDTSVNSRLLHSLRVYVSEGNEQTGKSNGFYNSANNATGLTFQTGTRGHAKLVAAAQVLDPIASGGARPSRAPVAAQGMNGAYMDLAGTIPGDWDTGPGKQIDGPYINRPDEGNSNVGYYNNGANTTAGTIVETGASFSPNRQMSSAVAFGSLPTGIDPTDINLTQPWRTLLFCKNPAAGSLHPGFGSPLSGPPYTKPPDHAFLDLFTMPIVEPYAISEPFSTAGRVNMNYQIVPFTYLTRDTGVRAVLKGTNMMAIPTADGRNYKAGTSVDFALTMPPDYRYTINPDETIGTLRGFEQRFGNGDIFRSASEICDIFLVPKYLVNTTNSAPGNPTYASMDTWWNTYQLTGDNVRESPYASIYPRLTTKSNTYTVHVQAQSLAKASNTAANDFVEGKDQVTGEFRGAFLVERYLDPNSDSLINANTKQPTNELDPDGMVGPYKFRVVNSKKFAP
ncbi:hypothetical protein BH09VER1_BH09VER1_31210 [soil metagenome]